MTADAILIRGGHVITMAPTWTTFRAVMSSVHGQIHSVGEGLRAPAGARPLDPSGQLVLPGLSTLIGTHG